MSDPDSLISVNNRFQPWQGLLLDLVTNMNQK